jgi:hypothetical protein
MKFNWKTSTIGQKIIFSSSLVAILSLLLPWADMGLISVNGFGQQGYILLIFYIYPLIKILKQEPITKKYGIISSSLAALSSIAFALSKSVEVFGTSVNLSGSGLILFILCSITLMIGIFISCKEDKTTNPE